MSLPEYKFKASFTDEKAPKDQRVWLVSLEDGVLHVAAIDDAGTGGTHYIIARKGAVLRVIDEQ